VAGAAAAAELVALLHQTAGFIRELSSRPGPPSVCVWARGGGLGITDVAEGNRLQRGAVTGGSRAGPSGHHFEGMTGS